jgi:uncharacterized protein (TIGR03437 family)
MKLYVSKAVSVCLALAVFTALAPLNEAQVANSITQISTVPNGLEFYVDGQNFNQTMAGLWPAGSKHTLLALPIEYSPLGDTQYSFTNWEWAGGTVVGGNQVVVTADPSISYYQAVYSISYAVNLVFSSCPSGTCSSPGTIYVNGAPFTHDATVFVPAGGPAVIQAFPADGYVFAGWASQMAGTAIQGFQQTLTVSQPVSVYPVFQVARTINLATVPSGLQVLQDRTPIATPASIEWGMGSVHTLGAVSPQSDSQGTVWVFASWSDNGASTHSYTVASIVNPDTVTATYVPGAPVTFATDPAGLNLSVDGRTNWPTYLFTWGVGETHTVTAPAQQTDAQGRIWNFSKWSNGGAATQTVTVPSSVAGIGMRLIASYTQAVQLTANSSIGGLVMTVNGSACALPCNVYQPVGTQVDVGSPLSVPVSSGSRQDFVSWSVTGAASTGTAANGDLLVTLGTNAVTVTPVYHLMNTLTASANPAGGATFKMQPQSADGYYDSQTTVTVQASVQPGYKFRMWSGDLSGSTATGSVAMSAPRTVSALLDSVPYIAPAGVVNGAGVTPVAAVAPGSVVSIFGSNLASTTIAGALSPMVQTLAGVTARIGEQMLPLYFVSPTQINFQLPPDLPAGAQTATISSQGQPDVQVAFQVIADAPGIFASSVSNGVTFGLLTHADGSQVTSTAPAQAGETLTLFGTGFGPTLPARPEGYAIPASPAYLLTDTATLQMGGVSVAPSNAYALPGAVGVDAIQFVVPAGLPSGSNASLTVTIGGTTSNIVQVPAQ